MTREEAKTVLENIKMDLEHYRGLFMYSNDINSVIERLKQPPTLADFLGWEEGQEYEDSTGTILMVDNGKIYYKSDMCSSGWCNYNFFGYGIEDLRQAKRVEPKKYYAKRKGWEVFESDFREYWNYCTANEKLMTSTKKSINTIITKMTKEEWEKLGIDDSNADFEEVE